MNRTTLLLLVATACSKESDTKATGTTSAKPAELAYAPLGDLGIAAEMPAGSIDSHRRNKAGTMTIEGNPEILVQGQGPEWIADAAGVKADIEKNMQAGKITKQDVKDDGTFRIEYTFDAGEGAIHGFTIRKKVGDKFFDCGTKPWGKTTVTTEQLAAAMKICDSLRAAK